MVADTVPAPAAGLPDSLPLPTSDSVPDSLRVNVILPDLPAGPPPGFATAAWVWDEEALLGVRDLTLLELLEGIPGVTPLRGGDYGSPEAASVFGVTAGRIRVFFDGFEMVPLDGGIPDLALIGLGGVGEVRVERGPGELRIHLQPLQAREPNPFSLVDAGTGDLDTNVFRGTFLHPRFLKGSLGLALERLDTRGTAGRETGHRRAGWVSWALPLFGESFALRAEVRRGERDVDADAFSVGLRRTDWVVRGRSRLLEGRVTSELFSGGSSLLSADDEGIVPVERRRSQHGLRVALAQGPAWAQGTLRFFRGREVPARTLELEGGGSLDRWGGAYVRWSSEAWPERTANLVTAHAWTAPALGLSAFGSFAQGEAGARIFPAYQPEPPEGEEPEPVSLSGHRFTERTTLRVGGAFAWRAVSLQAAALFLEVDSFPPLGSVLDRPGPVTPGDRFWGWEGQGRVGLPVDGFALTGAFQVWDQEGPYLAKRTYQGAIDFHGLFRESRNLEVWGALGVRGRDPMLVASPTGLGAQTVLVRVPFSQSWYTDLQLRIVTVRVFIRWENFTLRRNLQDYPDRLLPATRTVYGVRWILWN